MQFQLFIAISALIGIAEDASHFLSLHEDVSPVMARMLRSARVGAERVPSGSISSSGSLLARALACKSMSLSAVAPSRSSEPGSARSGLCARRGRGRSSSGASTTSATALRARSMPPVSLIPTSVSVAATGDDAGSGAETSGRMTPAAMECSLGVLVTRSPRRIHRSHHAATARPAAVPACRHARTPPCRWRSPRLPTEAQLRRDVTRRSGRRQTDAVDQLVRRHGDESCPHWRGRPASARPGHISPPGGWSSYA